MDSNRTNARRVVQDRLSRMPDELLHKILSCFDMKFAVQTCLLSSRWEFLWTSMPCLNFSSEQFGALPKFAKFVKHVLSHRNHQIQVSSVKLDFHGAVNQVFVKKIADYAFSHNVQELTVVNSYSSAHKYPPCLFSSQSLKHFKLVCNCFTSPKTPLNFPALTTLHLSRIELRGDLFSKCVNLKSLTLQSFQVVGLEEAFDIITPYLSNLTLIAGRCSKAINVIAPQLENLTIRYCSIKYLNAPSGLSSLCYTSDLWCYGLLQFSNDRFHSLNKVTICVSAYYPKLPCNKKDAGKIINMLQQLHSARYLTLDAGIVECISSISDMLSHHPSPFSNIICLTIDYSKKRDAFNAEISSEARNFLLENSPRAKLILKLPKVLQSEWLV